MSTILPRKTVQEVPLATNDNTHAALTADPEVTQFPQKPAMTLPPLTPPISPTKPQLPTLGAPTLPMAQPKPQAMDSSASVDADVLIENSNEHWVNSKWRPAMGWMYMGVCITDFVIFPVLWSLLQAIFKGNVTEQWDPLTLQGAGLFHIAMGAVLGIAAYGRTKEKTLK